jgi:hypothetical protein
MLLRMIKYIKSFFYSLQCSHRFKREDVLNIEINPKCVKCGRLLSECTSSKNLLVNPHIIK